MSKGISIDTWYLQQPDDTLHTITSDDGSYTLSDVQKSLDGSTVWCLATGIHGQTIESSKIKLMVLHKPTDDDSTTRSDDPKDTNRDGVTIVVKPMVADGFGMSN